MLTAAAPNPGIAAYFSKLIRKWKNRTPARRKELAQQILEIKTKAAAAPYETMMIRPIEDLVAEYYEDFHLF